VVDAPPELVTKWRAAAQPIVADWVKATPDGAKVLDSYRHELAGVEAGH
jgi:hypothetical protein